MASPSVSSLVEQIATAGKAYGNGENGARETLIDLGHLLTTALEIPSEFVQRTLFAQPAMSAILRLAVDRKIFQHLRDADAQGGLTPTEAAQKTGVEVNLLSRLLRHLVAMHLLTFRHGRFRASDTASSLGEERWQRGISFCYDCARPSLSNIPEYCRAHEYKLQVPSGSGPTSRTLFQATHGTDLSFFDWLTATPPHLQEFDTFMAAYRAGHRNWFDPGFYPVKERLLEGFDAQISNDVLLVDIAGGRGHDLALFAKQHKGHPGKLVLQDRPQVLAGIPDPESERPFQAQAHDVFSPEPVKHARAYFLHSVFHVFDDHDNQAVLESLKSALKPGYSRLLIHEIVVSEEHPTLAATSMDIMMMASHPAGVRERTEAEFRTMLQKAGYRVIKIWNYPGVPESLIEAEIDGE